MVTLYVYRRQYHATSLVPPGLVIGVHVGLGRRGKEGRLTSHCWVMVGHVNVPVLSALARPKQPRPRRVMSLGTIFTSKSLVWSSGTQGGEFDEVLRDTTEVCG